MTHLCLLAISQWEHGEPERGITSARGTGAAAVEPRGRRADVPCLSSPRGPAGPLLTACHLIVSQSYPCARLGFVQSQLSATSRSEPLIVHISGEDAAESEGNVRLTDVGF